MVGTNSHTGDALFVVETGHADGGIISEFNNSNTDNFGGVRILGGVTDRECRFQSLYGNSFFTFYTEGTGAALERMRINEDGNVEYITAGNFNGKANIFDGNNFTTASIPGFGDGDNIYLISDTSSAENAFGASIGFSRVQYPDRRAAAIAAVQTQSDEDRVGLAFFTHPSADAAQAIEEAGRFATCW